MKVKMTYGLNNNIDSVPIENGAVRVVEDKEKIYVDLNDKRINLNKSTNDVIFSTGSPSGINNIDCWFKLDLKVNPEFQKSNSEEISYAIKNNLVPKTWKTGDYINVLLNGSIGDKNFNNHVMGLKIISKSNQDIADDGSNVITLALCNYQGGNIALTDNLYYKEGLDNNFIMGKENVGWENSNIRNIICPQFYNCLPIEWQKIIKPVKKYTANNQLNEISYTVDKIFIPTEKELGYQNTYSFSQEYTNNNNYDYYSSTYYTRKIKYYTNNLCYYYTRSLVRNGNNEYCIAYGDTSIKSIKKEGINSLGFSPHFCVG